MVSHATKVKRDIDRWLAAGLIDARTAGALRAEIESGGGARVGLGTALAMMAASLFAAAILIFIAANWETMPRLLRVAMLLLAIATGYVGGALLVLRGRPLAGEVAWILAAVAFGASIALIAQMYQMSGDEVRAVFVWGAGTALAAAALRSSPLTVGAVLLAGVWLVLRFDVFWQRDEIPLAYLVIAAALYILSFWTRSVAARHMLALSLCMFAALHHWSTDTLAAPLVLIAAAVAVVAFAHARPGEAERILGLGSGLAVHALVAFLTGIGVLQVELYEDTAAFGLASAVALAGIVAMLLFKGRSNALLRWLAYLAFVFQLCFVYVVMLGSMLGTAGFFVLGGLALSLLAWLITRLERRFSGPAVAGGVS